MTALDRLLTVPEAAAVLGCSECSLWSRVRAGEVVYYRLGREVRVRPGDIRTAGGA